MINVKISWSMRQSWHVYQKTAFTADLCCYKQSLTLFGMGLSDAAHRWGGGAENFPSPQSVTHILQDETWHTYILAKEDPKNI